MGKRRRKRRRPTAKQIFRRMLNRGGVIARGQGGRLLVRLDYDPANDLIRWVVVHTRKGAVKPDINVLFSEREAYLRLRAVNSNPKEWEQVKELTG